MVGKRSKGIVIVSFIITAIGLFFTYVVLESLYGIFGGSIDYPDNYLSLIYFMGTFLYLISGPCLYFLKGWAYKGAIIGSWFMTAHLLFVILILCMNISDGFSLIWMSFLWYMGLFTADLAAPLILFYLSRAGMRERFN